MTEMSGTERRPAIERHATSVRRHGTFALVIALGLVTGACGAARTTDEVEVSGRRVQSARLVSQSAVPYEVRAYELVFPEQPGHADHARRAALLVDLVGGQGHVAGFTEWGRAGETPKTYVVGGWARQRSGEGEVVTVFELGLSYVESPEAPRQPRDPDDVKPVAVRIFVNETSGDVTLVSRR
jgi:hypothetical protein